MLSLDPVQPSRAYIQHDWITFYPFLALTSISDPGVNVSSSLSEYSCMDPTLLRDKCLVMNDASQPRSRTEDNRLCGLIKRTSVEGGHIYWSSLVKRRDLGPDWFRHDAF